MNNWLKVNWFKFGLLVLFTVSILCWFFVFLPLQRKELDLANKIKCQQYAKSFIESNKESFVFMRGDEVDNYITTFDSGLNTCLAEINSSGVSIDGQIFHTAKSILDVYTGKELARYTRATDYREKNEIVEGSEAKLHFDELNLRYFHD